MSSDVLFDVVLIVFYYRELTWLIAEPSFAGQNITQSLINADRLAETRRLYRDPKSRHLDLATCIGMKMATLASDPRDNAFALAAFAADIPPGLIDYNKSLLEVNIELAKMGLAYAGCINSGLYLLSLLSGPRTIKSLDPLPSWFPSLTHPSEAGFMPLSLDFGPTKYARRVENPLATEHNVRSLKIVDTC